jgi:hypothetical protein
VDCWTPQDKFDYQDIHNVDQARHEQNLSHLQSNLKRHERRYEIVRAFSRNAAGRFANASLDFVYIDANHKYPFIAEDLRLWWPKVKRGLVNGRLPDASRQHIQSSMKRGQPLGDQRWTQSTARRLGQQFTLNPTEDRATTPRGKRTIEEKR